MELTQIQNFLDDPNPQNRMKAMVELRGYEPAIVVPLLKQRMYDKEFIVRSFVAKGLGHKINDEGFQALLDLIDNDQDPNVKAEAANSLANYGEKAIPYLVKLFKVESHWLVRQSIFAVVNEINSPEILFQLSAWGLDGEDLVVKFISIANLGKLKGTVYEEKAVDLLCQQSTVEIVQVRMRVAKTLGIFDDPKAKATLAKLRADSDYKVVGATLENLVR